MQILRILVLSVFALVGCDMTEITQLEVAGIKFCVPSSQLVSAPYWVPADEVGVPMEMAVRSCLTKGGNEKGKCQYDDLIHMIVAPQNRYGMWKFPRVDSHYVKSSSAPTAVVELVGDSGVAVVYPDKSRTEWYVWRVGSDFTDKSSAFGPNSSSELVAVCRLHRPLPGLSRSQQPIAECSRAVVTPELSVLVSFYTQRSPRSLTWIDSIALKELNRLRCR